VLAFKAGQALERISNTLEGCHELTLNKLKQNTAKQLEMLLQEYKERNNNVNLPNDIDWKDIVEKLISIDGSVGSIQDQILGLYEIYLDLISKTIESPYFLLIIQFLGG